MIGADLYTALPEITLALFAMAALMVGVYGGKDKLAEPILWATAAIMVLLGLYAGSKGLDAQTAFNGMYIADTFAHFSKMIILFSAAVVLVMGQSIWSRADCCGLNIPF
jgi:NADH-quinone oxidoreductase subunit N